MNIKSEKTLDDFIYMEQLELKYYTEEHVTPHQEAYLWHQSNPNTGFVLEDDGRIAAFTDILPIKHELFVKILSGTFNDKYLTAEDLVPMEELKAGDSVHLLLSCVLVDDDYRETDALKTLLKAHLDYYRDFVKRGIIIDSVITSNVTEAGERFSERMGFERIGRSEHQTVLYRTSFPEFELQVRTMKSKLEHRLLQYEKNLLEPEFCRESASLECRIADEFTEYGQSGKIYSREAVILLLQSGRDTHVEIRDFNVRCLSRNVAMAQYIAVRTNDTDDAKENKSLRTSVWIREDGRWKLTFHQGTEIKD